MTPYCGAGPAWSLNAARMSTPGAVTSGLITSGAAFGPRELKDAIESPWAGLTSSVVPWIVPVCPLPDASQA